MRYVNKSNTAKHGKKYFKYLRLFSCNFPYNEDKSLTHRGNCTKYKLCNDVEENPGPVMHHVNPSKTILAPYIVKGCYCIWAKCRTTICCNEFVCFNIPQYERNK